MTKDEFMNEWQHKNETVEWVTGGVTGGSCWGTDANEAVYPEDEPELTMLDEILKKQFPNITYLQYRKLAKTANLVVIHRWEDREYYGNYYTKSSKMLDLDVLWEALEKL